MKKSILFILMLLMTVPAFAQKVSIYGVVSDMADGSPIVGVAVVSKDKNGTPVTGATTDIKGEYIITIDPKKEVSLEFSFLGYVSIAKRIEGKSRIDVDLEATSMTLESVVVTALGVDRKTKSLNYSRQAVTAQQLSENRTPDFVTSLQGRIAGLTVSSAGTNTGSSGVVIRGYSSATGDNNAIFVVDGVIMENGALGGESDGLDYGNGMGDINPDDIASIEVLKGPNATALYGSRASNGVIMITTKKSEGNNRIKVSYGNNTTFQTISEYPSYQNTFGVGMDLSIQTSDIMVLPNPITGGR
jgi:TonB-dependent SusC/RagA subfamily outer membrane receptor